MIEYKNSWSVKLIKRINSNRDEIWNLISSPKNLELYHPFCKSNNVIKWPGKGSCDELTYLNGIKLIRNFTKWEEKRGYELLIGRKNGSLYCAAKFALRGFSQPLSKDVINKNIRVSIINPGMVKTNFFENLNFEPGIEEANSICIKDISSTVAYILSLNRNTIVDEINLSPRNKSIKFK